MNAECEAASSGLRGEAPSVAARARSVAQSDEVAANGTAAFAPQMPREWEFEAVREASAREEVAALRRGEVVVRRAEEAARLRIAEANAVAERALVRARACAVEAGHAAEAELRLTQTCVEAAEAAAEAAEARASARIAEANAAADAVGMQAEARIASFEAEADAAMRRARTRAQAAEIAANGRVERALLPSEQRNGPVDTALSSVAHELPSGLAQRLRDVQFLLSGPSADATARALRRALEIHHQVDISVRQGTTLESCGFGSGPLLLATWGALLAGALDAMLRWSGLSAATESVLDVPATASDAASSAPLEVVQPCVAQQNNAPVSSAVTLWGELANPFTDSAANILEHNTTRSSPSPSSASRRSPSQISSASSRSSSHWRAAVAASADLSQHALASPSQLELTANEVRRSVAADEARLREENRTLRLKLGLRKMTEKPAGSGTLAVGTAWPPSPCRPVPRQTSGMGTQDFLAAALARSQPRPVTSSPMGARYAGPQAQRAEVDRSGCRARSQRPASGRGRRGPFAHGLDNRPWC